jgi:hypothetical protein
MIEPAIEPIERVKARAMQENRKYYFIVKDGARVGEEHIINDKMTLVDYERRKNKCHGGMKNATETI